MAPKTGVATPENIVAIQTNYIIAGVILAILAIIFAVVFIFKGIEEKEEQPEDFAKRPSFFESLKITLKNKTFVKFTIANLMVWYVFNTLMTIFPLYFTHVIEMEPKILITLSLVFALIVAALALPVHRKLNKKLGTRKAFMVTLALWIVLLIPYIFLGNTSDILAVFITGIQGLALSGCLFYVDILIGDVIDEDAVKFGVKRSASYYGVNAFIHRLSIILTISTIALVFQGTEWSGGYTVSYGVNVEIGLKIIMFLFPALGCCLAILFLKFFDLHGQKLIKMREELNKRTDIK
jgi:GPH family glycoside/pentoside/hexuronide:cation symporter